MEFRDKKPLPTSGKVRKKRQEKKCCKRQTRFQIRSAIFSLSFSSWLKTTINFCFHRKISMFFFTKSSLKCSLTSFINMRKINKRIFVNKYCVTVQSAEKFDRNHLDIALDIFPIHFVPPSMISLEKRIKCNP